MQAAVYTLLVLTTLRSVISHNATISKFTTGKTSNLNWHGHFVVIPATIESVFFIYTLKERKERMEANDKEMTEITMQVIRL
jgi:hypothetical protein